MFICSLGVFVVRSNRMNPTVDYLQAPLQPLMDNLESQTYEAFEKDPVKYKQYQRAIVKALEVEKEKEGVDTTVLMVSRDWEHGMGMMAGKARWGRSRCLSESPGRC